MTKAKGKLLRFSRKACGVSKEEMAERLEVTVPIIVKIEKGLMDITDSFIERWLEALYDSTVEKTYKPKKRGKK